MEKKILKELQEVIKNYISVNPEQLTLTCNLKKDLGLDSFDIICIVFDIEKKLNTSYLIEEVNKIETIEDLIQLIISKKESH